MAYDPVKAHEYYIKYRKKGLLKGRKKGSSKKTSSKKKGKTIALIGVSASGLNSDGAIEASLIKERLKAEMNAKLKSAKTDEEKIAIRKEYSKKANAEIAKLKADPKFAKQRASSSKSSGGSSRKSSESSSKKSSGSSSAKTEAQKTLEVVKDLSTQINDIYTKLPTMTEEERVQAREVITTLLDALKKKLGITTPTSPIAHAISATTTKAV